MLRCGHILLVFGLIAPAFLFGQETWRGLHFGMTLPDVKAKMILMSDPDNEDNWLGPTVRVIGLEFTPVLKFQPRLSIIELRYDAPADSSADMRVAYRDGEKVAKELASKYGSAVRESGDCQNSEIRHSYMPSCDVTFTSPGQSITLTYVGDLKGRLMFAKIVYKPVSDSV